MIMKNLINAPQIYRAIWQIPAIIALSVIFSFGFNAIRTKPLPFIGDWSNEERLTTDSGEQLIISITEAQASFVQKNAVFIDARDHVQFEEGHIKNEV